MLCSSTPNITIIVMIVKVGLRDRRLGLTSHLRRDKKVERFLFRGQGASRFRRSSPGLGFYFLGNVGNGGEV